MALPNEKHCSELIAGLTGSWHAGSGTGFSDCFTHDAHFVAFDGTALGGPKAIAEYHQAAFDRYLQNTELIISVEQSIPLADCALLLFINGSIQDRQGRHVMLTGESLATLVVVLRGDRAKIQAFQNTRKRPIQDRRSADVWKAFDRLWAEQDSTPVDQQS